MIIVKWVQKILLVPRKIRVNNMSRHEHKKTSVWSLGTTLIYETPVCFNSINILWELHCLAYLKWFIFVFVCFFKLIHRHNASWSHPSTIPLSSCLIPSNICPISLTILCHFFYNNPLNQNLLNIYLCVRAIQWDMGHLSMATIPKMSGFFKNSQQPSVPIISPTRHGASGAPPPSLHTA